MAIGVESALRWLLATRHEAEVERAFIWLENTILTRARVLMVLGANGASLPGQREPLQNAVAILAKQLEAARKTHNSPMIIRV